MAEELVQDSGTNLSEMNLTMITGMNYFGALGYDRAEAVKFTAPTAGWKLNSVQVLGWDGFNGTRESVPIHRTFRLDVRDADLNLLYTFTDTQVPYFNYRYNLPEPLIAEIDLPSLTVSGDFYICFYDRASVVIGAETENPTGNSFFFDRATKRLVPAELPTGNNMTMPVNWIIRAVGE
jgi:hypothetical protein